MKPALSLNAWMRYDLVRRLLRPLEHEIRSVLEIGCGGGAVGARLASRFDYVGLDPDRRSSERAAARVQGRGRIICGDLSALEPGMTFDLVCSFEVLEHLEDDAAALREWRARLRTGGWLLLSAPAHQRRFGPHDRIAGHYRRYDRPALDDLLRRAGFEAPLILMCGFPFGYALEFGRNTIARLAHRRTGEPMEELTAASGRWLQPPDALAWVTAGVSAPFRLVQRPFARTELGTGVVALARRRD